MDTLNHYTDSQKKLILKSLIYLVDTREKENSHIISYFDKAGLKWRARGLECGDYSVMINAIPELGIMLPKCFDKPMSDGIYIERKNSLEELASNLGTYRQRFELEIERMKSAHKHLVIEAGNFYKIMCGDYNSQLSAQSYYNTLQRFNDRYNLSIHFVDKSYSGAHIRSLLDTRVKEYFSC